jgi:hypothetical protein
MTALEKQHTWRVTLTVCPRCKAQPGSHDWPKSWLNELTIADGLQSAHALLCRRPSCAFAEIIGLRGQAVPAPARRRHRWLRDALAARPITFVLAALVQGIAIGMLLALR